MTRKKICLVSTSATPLVVFMRPHIAMLSKYYDLTLVANGSKKDFSGLLNKNIHFVSIPIKRKISPLYDFYSLYKLLHLFRKEKFVLVHSLMPKSSILAMVAAFFAGIPYRIHTFTGQVWATKTGFKRYFLKFIDTIVVKFSTDLLADSHSQREFLIRENVVNEDKILVLANGSVSGVNLKRFFNNSKVRLSVRKKLSIPIDAKVLLFIGRLNNEKGVLDLVTAFSQLATNFPNLYLLLVGEDECSIEAKVSKILYNLEKKYRRVPFTPQPENYMNASDIICLPSYREGFGSVLIEAASIGLPSIASNIYGIRDAVLDGKTGVLHEPKNILEIKMAIIKLIENKGLCSSMSKQASIRAKTLFSEKIVVNAMKNYYKKLL